LYLSLKFFTFIDVFNLKFNVSRFQKNIFLVQIDDQINYKKELEKKINSLNVIIGFYEKLIDISDDAYIGVDRNGEIILFNSGAQKALGYDLEEIKNIKIWNIYPSLSEAKKVGAELYKNNGKIEKFPTKLKTKFDNLIEVHLNAFFIYDDDKNPLGSIGVFRID